MRELVRAIIQARHPLILGPDPSMDQEKREAQERVIADMLIEKFDALLPNMLRKKAFMDLYFQTFGKPEVLGDERAIPYLQELVVGDKGVVFYGDVAYLKHANNISSLAGDGLLRLIAAGIESANCMYYGRDRTGDEFVIYHNSFEVARRAIETLPEWFVKKKKETEDLLRDQLPVPSSFVQAEVVELAKFTLPVSIDFGYVEHREVALTYLLLLQEGWRPDEGRSAIQVFYDIAEKIVQIRCSVQKIYCRAWLLYDYLEIVFESHMYDKLEIAALQQSDQVTIDNYNQAVDWVTRGGKYVVPEESWLTMTKEELRDHISLQTLKLLSPSPDADLFTRVVTERAESIFLLQN